MRLSRVMRSVRPGGLRSTGKGIEFPVAGFSIRAGGYEVWPPGSPASARGGLRGAFRGVSKPLGARRPRGFACADPGAFGRRRRESRRGFPVTAVRGVRVGSPLVFRRYRGGFQRLTSHSTGHAGSLTGFVGSSRRAPVSLVVMPLFPSQETVCRHQRCRVKRTVAATRLLSRTKESSTACCQNSPLCIGTQPIQLRVLPNSGLTRRSIETPSRSPRQCSRRHCCAVDT